MVSANPAVMGKKIYQLIEKNQLLLLQDKVFPNIITEITGETVSGSWWGHPQGNAIYNGLMWLEHNSPVVSLKLIDGKVTYIHEKLFADIYAIVHEPREWQVKKLKPEDLKVFKHITKKKKTTSEDKEFAKLAKDPKKALATLEKKLLVFSHEEHTETGKHIKEFMVWEKSPIARAKVKDVEAAQRQIEYVVDRLAQKTGAKVKLPWR